MYILASFDGMDISVIPHQTLREAQEQMLIEVEEYTEDEDVYIGKEGKCCEISNTRAFAWDDYLGEVVWSIFEIGTEEPDFPWQVLR